MTFQRCNVLVKRLTNYILKNVFVLFIYYYEKYNEITNMRKNLVQHLSSEKGNMSVLRPLLKMCDDVVVSASCLKERIFKDCLKHIYNLYGYNPVSDSHKYKLAAKLTDFSSVST